MFPHPSSVHESVLRILLMFSFVKHNLTTEKTIITLVFRVKKWGGKAFIFIFAMHVAYEQKEMGLFETTKQACLSKKPELKTKCRTVVSFEH